MRKIKNKPEFLPIILGSDENAYACARMFYEAYKIRPLLLCATPLLATSHSKILTRTVIPNLDLPSVFECRMPRLLAELKNDYGKLLLISCSDYYTELASSIAPEIEKFIENKLLQNELLHSFSDKSAFSELAKKLKISHPETLIIVPSEINIDSLPFSFPIILKPANSNSSDYLRAQIPNKKKAYICNSTNELQQVLHSFKSCGFDQTVIIQPFISGGCENMYVVNAYCDRNGKARLVGAAQVILDYSDEKSLGNYLVLRTIKNRELCNRACEILESIGYYGFANFDIKKDPENEEFYFFELNPRPGRSSYYLHTAGTNPMRTLADDVIFGSLFTERQYAESDGIWSTLPREFLKNRISSELFSCGNFGYALKYENDFSFLRSLAIARRNYKVAKQNLLSLKRK